jgi:hypothetical protein
MHHPQPLHACSLMRIMPVFFSCDRAFFGQDATQTGSSHFRQETAMLVNGPMLITRMRDLCGLKVFSLAMLQAYSHRPHPLHFSGSETINFLS